MDGRTREGRALRVIREDLLRQCRGEISAVQLGYVKRAATLIVALSRYDERAARGDELSEIDKTHYNKMSDSLGSILTSLKIKQDEASRFELLSLAEAV